MKPVLRTLLIAAACAVGAAGAASDAPEAAVPNTARLGALDWTPFEAA